MPVVLSHQNLLTYLFRTVLDCFAFQLCLMHISCACAYFSPDSDETTYPIVKVILWIDDSFEFKNILMIDFFTTNMQFWTEVV